MDTGRIYPTHVEVLAIERAARRAQAAEMVRLLKLGASKLKGVVSHASAEPVQAANAVPASNHRAAPSKSAGFRATDIDAFAASLPEHIRRRYASDLEAAARIEPLVNAGLAAADFAARTLARAFHAAAGALHAAARSLDVLARRLTPMH